MDTNKPVSFAIAAKDFFGLLPGQRVADFAVELKALTEADRAEMTEDLRAVGYNIQ